MKDRFIRVISPFTAFVSVLLDVAVIFYFNYLIQKINKDMDIWTIMFVVIELLAIAIAVAVSVEVLKNGVKFSQNQMEFTGIDDNNTFEYDNIDHIETSRDTKASLRKNFVDRYSHILIYTKDGNITTITLGLTTNKTLKKIENEINERIGK